MTVAELLEQAKSLSTEERKELAKLLIDTLDNQPIQSFKTGDEIAHYIEQHPPIELVDSHIDDPVEWTMVQRQKRQDY
ncbi:MAG: hypothetical protein AAFV93_06250, partial [Chloroflexota bacterium]